MLVASHILASNAQVSIAHRVARARVPWGYQMAVMLTFLMPSLLMS
jgi:hypothetical protein